jgi:transcriptional regulator with XRE-family HTH domain
MNTRNFWDRVKTCVKEKGVTQMELAKSCKFTYGTFRNWISKNINPPLMYAYRISKYLGVSLEYLISGSGKDDVSKTNEEVLVLLKEAEEKLRKIRRNN